MMCTSPAGQVAARALQRCRTGAMCSGASSAASSIIQTGLRAEPPLFNPRLKILFLWQQQSAGASFRPTPATADNELITNSPVPVATKPWSPLGGCRAASAPAHECRCWVPHRAVALWKGSRCLQRCFPAAGMVEHSYSTLKILTFKCLV